MAMNIEQHLSNTRKGRMDTKIIDIVKILKHHGIHMPYFPRDICTTKQKVGYYGLLVAMAKKHDIDQRHFWYLKRKGPFPVNVTGRGKIWASAEEMTGMTPGSGVCGRCAKVLR